MESDTGMKFWILKMTATFFDYEETFVMVVVARDEKDAQRIASKSALDECSSEWENSSKFTCKLLDTKNFNSSQVICQGSDVD